MTYHYYYAFDKGLNLIEQTSSSNQTRMIVAADSNRAVQGGVYRAMKFNSSPKANLNQAFLNEGIFDGNGNQLKSSAIHQLSWDYRNMLLSTVSAPNLKQGAIAETLNEYNVYSKSGRRNRKITEKTDTAGNIIEISEALYIENLEYRSTWIGNNLSYDGEVVYEGSKEQSPYEVYVALRIRQGHKQVAEKRLYTVKEGVTGKELSSFFSLDNNIDSCELKLDDNGELSAYYASKPYGETAVNVVKKQKHPYKYSGQEKDESGLYYYGYRSLLPQNFRWMSADPTGIQGSGMNWYAMVNGNPVTRRDEFGLDEFTDLINGLMRQSSPSFNGVISNDILGLIFAFRYKYRMNDPSTIRHRGQQKYPLVGNRLRVTANNHIFRRNGINTNESTKLNTLPGLEIKIWESSDKTDPDNYFDHVEIMQDLLGFEHEYADEFKDTNVEQNHNRQLADHQGMIHSGGFRPCIPAVIIDQDETYWLSHVNQSFHTSQSFVKNVSTDDENSPFNKNERAKTVFLIFKGIAKNSNKTKNKIEERKLKRHKWAKAIQRANANNKDKKKRVKTDYYHIHIDPKGDFSKAGENMPIEAVVLQKRPRGATLHIFMNIDGNKEIDA